MMTSNSSQSNVKNQAQDTDDTKAQSFSSALDKQVSQQDSKTNKAEEKEPKLVKPVKNEQKKPDISDDKSGKILPDKVAETTDNQDKVEEGEFTVTAEVSPDMQTEKVETDVVEEESLFVATGDEQKQQDVIDLEFHGKLTVPSDASLNKKNQSEASKAKIAENSKSALDIDVAKEITTESTEELAESPSQKQQVTSLRSDILNALQKKPTSESDKFASAIDKKIVTSSTLTPIAEEGLSEEQKIMALANSVKSKGLSFTGGTVERNVGVSAATYTPPTIGTNTPVSNVVSSGQPTLDLQPALQSEAWSRVLSSRVIWMAREGVQQASLKLNPANMGPVEVKLHMHNEQANISFIAQHAATRDALEQALPRLRESFQENGMELAHADVSQENFSQTDEQDNKTTNNDAISGGSITDDDIDPSTETGHVNEQDVELGLSVFA